MSAFSVGLPAKQVRSDTNCQRWFGPTTHLDRSPIVSKLPASADAGIAPERLGYEKHDAQGRGTPNSRNGTGTKRAYYRSVKSSLQRNAKGDRISCLPYSRFAQPPS